MKRYRSFRLLITNFSLILTMLFVSCASTKKVPYFLDASKSSIAELSATAEFVTPVIQIDDILSISIFTIDPVTSMIINQLGTQSVGNANVSSNPGQLVTGFLVDKNGEIELSVIGKLKLSGLTTDQAKEIIRQKAAQSFTNPTIQIRFSNFKVTVLGEVQHPAIYTVPNEKLSVLDALGLAGDLTIYGKRENVLLIRESNNKKQFIRLNLNTVELFNSPYFFLRQNDVLYVEPNKGKAASLNTARTQTLAIIGTALTVLIALISRI